MSNGSLLEVDPVFTVVEVGCNDTPITARGEYPFPSEHQYIGFDKNSQSLEDARTATAREAPQVNAQFVEADAKKLPLPDDCADEFFVGNVFGDPMVDFIRVTSLAGDKRRAVMDRLHPDAILPGLGEFITPDDFITIPRILREAKRVLKDEGKLTILETLTPLPDQLMKDLLSHAGISLARQVNFGDEEWEAAVRPYYTFAATDENGVNTEFGPPVLYVAHPNL